MHCTFALLSMLVQSHQPRHQDEYRLGVSPLLFSKTSTGRHVLQGVDKSSNGRDISFASFSSASVRQQTWQIRSPTKPKFQPPRPKKQSSPLSRQSPTSLSLILLPLHESFLSPSRTLFCTFFEALLLRIGAGQLMKVQKHNFADTTLLCVGFSCSYRRNSRQG